LKQFIPAKKLIGKYKNNYNLDYGISTRLPLGITHLRTGEPFTWEAPLPEDF
jgi:hypothetical protein